MSGSLGKDRIMGWEREGDGAMGDIYSECIGQGL